MLIKKVQKMHFLKRKKTKIVHCRVRINDCLRAEAKISVFTLEN